MSNSFNKPSVIGLKRDSWDLIAIMKGSISLWFILSTVTINDIFGDFVF